MGGCKLEKRTNKQTRIQSLEIGTQETDFFESVAVGINKDLRVTIRDND